MNIGKLAVVTLVMAFAAKYVSANDVAIGGGSTPLKVGMAFDQGLSAVIKYDDRFNFTVGNDGMAFDLHLIEGDFPDDIPLTWFIGAGAWYEWNDDFGIRAPIGLNFNFASDWDVYAQIQPEWQIQDKTQLQFGASIGLTYNF